MSNHLRPARRVGRAWPAGASPHRGRGVVDQEVRDGGLSLLWDPVGHVLEDLEASGWRPGPGFAMPPAQPNRDFSRPA